MPEPDYMLTDSDAHSFEFGLRLLAKLIAANLASAAKADTALPKPSLNIT